MSQSERIHLIGVCGTGMAGLACLLKDLGYEVTGSDNDVYPPMDQVLEKAGISIWPFDQRNLEIRPHLVVLGAGVSRRNTEATAAVQSGLQILSCPAALNHLVLKGRESLVVAGTHGKTTTASMLAWIFEKAGRSPGFFIGGKPQNFGQSARVPKGDLMIVEGDEYKSSNLDLRPKFASYRPHAAVITNIEFDHADYFTDMTAVLEAFENFVGGIGSDGVIVTAAETDIVRQLQAPASCPIVRVGRDRAANWRLVEHSGKQGLTTSVHERSCHGVNVGPFTLRIPGRHNSENAGLAAVAAHLAGIDNAAIVEALETFEGVARRLELVAEREGVRLFDDFAHHPTEVSASIRALKLCHGQSRVWVIFEPRSATSRSGMFQEAYARALSGAGRVTVRAVVPRWEGERILDTSELANSISERGIPATATNDVETMVDEVMSNLRSGDVIVVMSSGPFGGLVDALRIRINALVDAPRVASTAR